jgi:uncharacterized damage-inducible protein DinB
VAETFEEYQKRIAGYVRGRDPRRILRATPRRLARKIAGISRARLAAPPSNGKWSAAQILAHLSELEMLWGYRVRMILETDEFAITGMDQDAWARNSRYDRIDPRRSLETFTAIRRANLDLLGRLSPRQLRRRGVHSQFGEMTIGRIFSLLAGHDINHTRQIERILTRRGAAPRPPSRMRRLSRSTRTSK